MTKPGIEKVVALITRRSAGGTELLLFRHPYAGVQIPAGTVEEGEEVVQAALREAAEESGLENFSQAVQIGWQDQVVAENVRLTRRPARVYARPDPGSFQWAAIRRGIQVTVERMAGRFAQIRYEEADDLLNPQYTSYCILGWAEQDDLTRNVRRYFFHLQWEGESGREWQAATDNHIFRPFWAALAALPEIIPPQQAWLDFVQGELRYRLE